MKKILESKLFKFIFGTFEVIIFGSLILYLSFVLCQRLSGNMSIMGYRLFTVATGSMIPVYNINDVIIVKDVNTKDLKVGDDITYRGTRGGLEGLIISHRIIKIDDNTTDGCRRIFTQGVNNKYPDPSISEDQVVGKIVGKLFIINTINHLVKNQYGFFFLVFCPIVIIISIEIIQTSIELKEEKLGLVKVNDDVNNSCIKKNVIVSSNKGDNINDDEEEEII